MIIFGKFGDGQAERNRTVSVFFDNPMRLVTLPLALAKEETKEGSPLRIGHGPSRPVISDANFRQSAPFLPGSAQNVECDVTLTKQTVGEFLPGATTVHFASRMIQRDEQFGSRMFSRDAQCRALGARNSAFLTGSASQTEFGITRSKQTTVEFLTGARTAFKVAQFRGESQAQREKECCSRLAPEQGKIPLHKEQEKEQL